MTSFDEGERAPEERPPAPAEEGDPGEGSPPTTREDAAEPAGDEDPGNEREIDEATERPEELGGGEGDAGSGEGEDGNGGDGGQTPEAQRDEYLALAQRTQADFENFRKRAAKEAAAAGERARNGLVRELLPIVDNLERALASAQEGEQHLADGVRLVHSELVAVLTRNGVEGFDPAGERFDPNFHEAISTRAQDGAESGVVLDTVERGYRKNGAVLRPARVVVAS